MQQASEIIIVDDKGTEHRFPAGFDPKRAAAIVRGQTQPAPIPTQAPTRQYPPGHKGYDSGIDPAVAQQRVRDLAPAIASTGAAYATGGMSVPVQMAAAGAAGSAGQAFKDSATDMPIKDRFSNMAFEGLKQMGIQGTTGAIAAAAPRLQQAARNLWNKSAKVTDQVANKTQTMRSGGSALDGKDEIAETVLSRGMGTLKRANVETMRESLNALDSEIETIIANSDKLVSRRDIAAAIRSHMKNFTKDTSVGLTQRSALDETARILNKRAPRMTVQEAQKAKREIYDFYQKNYPAGAVESIASMAAKTQGRALRDAIASVEPGVSGPNAQMSKLIPATSAMEKSVSRIANHNVAGLSQILAGAVPNPATLAAALLNNPRIGSFTAQQLYNAAKRLPTQARTAANIIRMASIGSSGDPVASHQTGRD